MAWSARVSEMFSVPAGSRVCGSMGERVGAYCEGRLQQEGSLLLTETRAVVLCIIPSRTMRKTPVTCQSFTVRVQIP